MLKYLLILASLLIPTNLFASKYDVAIKVASEAAFKQSGLESSFIQTRSVGERKIKQYVASKGLTVPATVIAYTIPIVYKKRIQFRMGNFKVRADSNKSEVTWNIQF